jgi:cell wall-associated NlpC family hydrolase
MRIVAKGGFALLVCGVLCTLSGQSQSAPAHASKATTGHPRKGSLNKSDRQRVIAAALSSKRPRYGEHDCSHLVHAIYQRAGFPYQYADSDDLYAGVGGFQRVSKPQPADLVVWHGHVGIVTQPSHHQFFSFLSAGPGVDNYRSRYWRGRGEARFYRYVKNDACPGCTPAARDGE